MVKLLSIAFAISITLAGGAKHSRPCEEIRSPSLQLVTTVTRVLERNGRSGSLIYRGICSASGLVTEPFHVAAATVDAPALEALRSAFKNDPSLRVQEYESSFIRVTGGNVQPDLLELKLRKVAFVGETDPREAVGKLLASSEVKAYMQAHHIDFINVMNGLIPPPSGLRLNTTLENVSLAQALDAIAQRFPGVWVYGECEMTGGERRIYVLFHEFSGRPPSQEP